LLRGGDDVIGQRPGGVGARQTVAKELRQRLVESPGLHQVADDDWI
jgi:hypothetical protein